MAVMRLDAALVFDDQDPAARRLYEQIVALAPRLREFVPVDSGRPERSRATLHRCFHDEPGGKACEPVSSWGTG